jgi:hypothetical protein
MQRSTWKSIRWSATAGVCFSLVGGLGLTGSSRAAIPAQPPGSYVCVAEASNLATPPPPPAVPAGAAQKSTTALCPPGQVPQSEGPAVAGMSLAASQQIATTASHEKRTPIQASSGLVEPLSVGGYGGYYYYAIGRMGIHSAGSVPAGTSGLEALQTQQNPTTDPNDPSAHSISQMWLLDWGAGGGPNDGNSDVEYGWDVSPTLFGSGGPHLFIFRFDGGNGTCYNAGPYYGCPTATNCPNTGPSSSGYPGDNGWAQVSGVEYPGELLTHDDRYHTYVVENFEGNWWVSHDGTWMGYYGGCAWGAPITGINELQAGGEVFSKTHATAAPTQMGNGQPGNTPNAAAWEDIATTRSGGASSAEMHSYQSDPTQFTTGNWFNPTGEKSGSGPSFRYGGGAG